MGYPYSFRDKIGIGAIVSIVFGVGRPVIRSAVRRETMGEPAAMSVEV